MAARKKTARKAVRKPAKKVAKKPPAKARRSARFAITEDVRRKAVREAEKIRPEQPLSQRIMTSVSPPAQPTLK